MLRRLGVPALLLTLTVAIAGTPAATAAAPASDVVARPAATRCPDESLSDRAVIRARDGARLGIARMYVTPMNDEFVFCVRVTPVERLRSRDTLVFVRHRTVGVESEQSPSMTIGISWRRPFVLYGSFEPGSGIAAVTTIRASDGTRGKARIRATVS